MDEEHISFTEAVKRLRSMSGSPRLVCDAGIFWYVEVGTYAFFGDGLHNQDDALQMFKRAQGIV